jgi:hypothetical protein
MNKQAALISLLLSIIVSQPVFGEKQLDNLRRDRVKAIVEQMRGISMQLSPTGKSDGRPDLVENKKRKILAELAAFGQDAIPPLVGALKDKDVQMRRNACLALINLAGTWTSNPRVDTSTALPALIEATKDSDGDVRGWAAHAIAEMAPAPQKMRLDPNIKVGLTGKISEIRDAGDWANPFITVSDDAITISWGKSMHHKRLHHSVLKRAEEIEGFLVGLPVSAWPYGRIIALSEHPLGGLSGGRAYRKQSWDLIMAAMKRLDVQVNPWPCG